MCWSVCPGGYYSNNTDNACHICPTSINCGNCTYISASDLVVCTTCAYSHFLHVPSTSCRATCDSNQYANKGNNTCIDCLSACLSCSGPTDSACLSCLSPLLLIQNLTGAYCISACDPVGYTQSGSNCLSCDSSCLTCTGTANSHCSSCASGSFLSSSYCRLVCPPATFPNPTANTCDACDGSCGFCFGGTIDNCTGCISSMVLFNFTCTLACPAGYTVNQWNVCSEPHFHPFLLLLLVLLLMI